MRLRSLKKIEALVIKAFPNAEPFRREGYQEAFRRYQKAVKKWDTFRDSICHASDDTCARCVCDTDPRLVSSPLKEEYLAALNLVNQLDNEAYLKLTTARNELTAVYLRVNELKQKA